MVLSGKVEQAFDVSQESDQLRDKYGRVSVGEKRFWLDVWWRPECFCAGKWSLRYFDHHGDNVRWGGIERFEATSTTWIRYTQH